MIPTSTTTEGFGACREAVTISWASMASPIAIVAPKGSGKTWLLESPFAALFGRFAWYGGNPPSLYNALSLGGTGQGRLELDFRHNGETYHAERMIKDTGKTKSPKALLWKDGVADPIAGPKVGDFDAWISANIGDEKTALATWCLSQNRLGDLCGTPGEKDLVAYRRSVMHELLDTKNLDAIEKRLSEVARKQTATAEELEAQLAGERDLDYWVIEENASMGCAITKKASKECGLKDGDSDLEAARTRLRDAEGGDDVLRAQVKQHKIYADAVSQAVDRAMTVQGELSDRSYAASGLERAIGKRQRLEFFQSRRDDLQEQKNQFDAWQAWDWDCQRIETAIAAGEETVRTLESFPGLDEETKALAARLPEIEEEYREAKTKNEDAEVRNHIVGGYFQEIEKGLSVVEASLHRVRKEIEDKPKTLFGDDCATCPQITKWAELPQQEQTLVYDKGVLELKLKNTTKALPIVDLTDLIAKGERARAAAKAVKEAPARQAQLDQDRKGLSEHKGILAGHKAIKPPEATDPGTELVEAQKEIDELAGAPEQVKACEQATHDAAAKKLELDKAETALAEAREAEKVAREPAESASAALENREEQRATIRAEVETLDAKVKELRAEIEDLTKQIARHEARIGELERRQAEQADKRAKVKKYRNDLAGYAHLRNCFGTTKGVRQILIDNAAPELEAIANNLFDIATEGKMRLRIATQRVNNDGTTAEDFGILVTDKVGERDVLEYSGGEQQLNRILFRSAVALWVARLRGQQPECLFLDEACDGLGVGDSEGVDELMRVLDYLGEQIPLIVVVTHDPVIAARMRSQVRVTNTFAGVSVDIKGGRQ